ncbi:hypothetical protein H6P81_020994 [Aristolochia fimbriata]|uniref:Neprosin PEP catalytic domain-containing protein n=1 Tax=Aristolochia fimbriata TaxID=158543 RepID=A0AAV7DXU7_ARIFI|nr:hypothetical protein H6P81_020994 [Aristolochia fimbriata]
MGLSLELGASALFSFFLFFLVVVADGDQKISNREYLAMKRQLRSLTKPGVKVIKVDKRETCIIICCIYTNVAACAQTKYGDIYDCVDIHKQPSLDHPLLKNHTVQMAPTNYKPLEVPKKNASESGSREVDIFLPAGGCPEGTVPVERLTVEDLIMGRAMRRMKRKEFLQRLNNQSTNNIDGYQHHYAIVRAQSRRFYGFSGKFNVWHPGTVYYSQNSLSEMWLFGGPISNLNTIQAGWMVMYSSKHLNSIRFYNSDTYRDGCYNLECQGFIRTSTSVTLPVYLHPTSTYNGEQRHVTLQINRDTTTNHWWLVYGEEQIPVGYWADEFFHLMLEHATGYDYGGEVVSTTNQFPEMGSGHFAEEGYGKAAFMSEIMLIDKANRLVDAPNDKSVIISNRLCYNIINDHPRTDPHMGKHIFFGGPSGNCFR